MGKFLFFCFLFSTLAAVEDALPSWREGDIKSAIVNFVKETTDKNSPHFVPEESRIACFDQDGTLWVEQPVYTQVFFILETIQNMAKTRPEWSEKEPFKTILSGDKKAMARLDQKDIETVINAVHEGVTVEEFRNKVQEWLQIAVHPRFKKPFTKLVYQPMLELIQLFKNHHFQVYIVSGGGQEFMRAYCEAVYGIPPNRIIGTAGKVQYKDQEDRPALYMLPELLFVNDFAGKPEGINLVIGIKPAAAFGNSDGDQQMLEWTQSGKGKRLELLVHHDDSEREYAYDSQSKVGTFSEKLMSEAKKKGWLVVSMKNDWKKIFPD